jgi:serine/threonine protein kinase
MYVIGRGGFGKVWKVYSKKYKRAYALKEMSKAKIIDKKSERSIRFEKELLSKMNHPYYNNNIQFHSKYVLLIPRFGKFIPSNGYANRR